MIYCFTTMDITYLGHSSFKLKGKTTSVITDPFSNDTGLKFPKVEANIVTITHDHTDHNNSKGVGGDPVVVNGAGEYEIGGVSIFGVPSYHDAKGGEERGRNTIYVIRIDGINVCHLGDLGHKLSTSELDEIGTVDILLVPVGGVYTVDAAGANEVVSQLEPKVVIPMHYKVPGLKYELESLDGFLKEIGLEPTRDTKFTVVPSSLPDTMQLVVLESKTT